MSDSALQDERQDGVNDTSGDTAGERRSAGEVGGSGSGAGLPSLLQPDITIARVCVTRLLGTGAVGEIWLGQDLEADTEVALKVIRPKWTSEPLLLSRIQMLAQQVVYMLHPHILSTIRTGTDQGMFYFVSDIAKRSVLQRIHRKGPVPLGEAMEYVRKAAEALQFAQRKGLLHGDIKSSNILLTSDGDLKVSDFGLTRAIREFGGIAAPEFPVGGPNFMSPEATICGTLDQRSDIYSLGIVLYEMLTGELPFTGPTAMEVMSKQIGEALPEDVLLRLRDQHGNRLIELLDRMTAKDPEERYQDYAEVLNGVYDVLHPPAARDPDTPVLSELEFLAAELQTRKAAQPPPPDTKPLEQAPEASAAEVYVPLDEKREPDIAAEPEALEPEMHLVEEEPPAETMFEHYDAPTLMQEPDEHVLVLDDEHQQPEPESVEDRQNIPYATAPAPYETVFEVPKEPPAPLAKKPVDVRKIGSLAAVLAVLSVGIWYGLKAKEPTKKGEAPSAETSAKAVSPAAPAAVAVEKPATAPVATEQPLPAGAIATMAPLTALAEEPPAELAKMPTLTEALAATSGGGQTASEDSPQAASSAENVSSPVSAPEPIAPQPTEGSSPAPAPAPAMAASEVVVDDQDPGALILLPDAAAWRASAEPLRSFKNHSLIALCDGKEKSATFLGSIPESGRYQVLLRWVTSGMDFRADKVPVYIHTSKGLVKVEVSQVRTPDDFMVIGVYDFAAGNRKPLVSVSTEGIAPGATRFVSVDALKLVPAQ